MNMSKEAMKLALEALKNTTPTGFNMESDKKFFAAIKALEEALANQTCEMGVMCLQCPDAIPKQEQGAPVADALLFSQWTAAKKDLSDYICVGSLTLAGIENGEYGQSEIDSFENTIEALQEKLITGDSKKVPLLAYIGATQATPQQRTWVGLQDWEIKKLVENDKYTNLLTTVAIAVEKELKARNT
jgi:hypothetical protein